MKLLKLYKKAGILVFLLLEAVVFAFIAPNFLSGKNIMNLLRQVAMLGIATTGISFIMIGGNAADLSIAGQIPTLTMLCGVGMAQKQIWLRVLLGLAGLAVCHLLGVIQFAIVAATPFPAAFVAVSVPYIVKDVISVVGAYLVAIPIRKALAAVNILEEKTKAAV